MRGKSWKKKKVGCGRKGENERGNVREIVEENTEKGKSDNVREKMRGTTEEKTIKM